jgi:hypothetical protein
VVDNILGHGLGYYLPIRLGKVPFVRKTLVVVMPFPPLVLPIALHPSLSDAYPQTGIYAGRMRKYIRYAGLSVAQLPSSSISAPPGRRLC